MSIALDIEFRGRCVLATIAHEERLATDPAFAAMELSARETLLDAAHADTLAAIAQHTGSGISFAPYGEARIRILVCGRRVGVLTFDRSVTAISPFIRPAWRKRSRTTSSDGMITLRKPEAIAEMLDRLADYIRPRLTCLAPGRRKPPQNNKTARAYLAAFSYPSNEK